MKRYDLIVIGSGSGLEVSTEAAEQGLSVAVVEEGPFGGTCHNRGCIPSKILIYCADVMETVQRAAIFGVKAKVEGVDWSQIIRRATVEIDAEAQAIEAANREARNISVHKGRGRFVGMKTLEVEGERITAEQVVIAAGTRPSVPEIPGLRDVPFITSDEALRLPEQPRRMAIIGGGDVAAEMAHFFGTLGTEVTIIHRGPWLLRDEDEDVSHRFTHVLQQRFNVLLNSQVARAADGRGEIVLEIASGGRRTTLTVDTLLIATGRIPNTDLLEVENTGVEVDERGFVKTNPYMETNVPGVWALGDVVGRYLLKHNANLEAAHVANNLLNPQRRVPVDYQAMPHAVFSSPQIGAVGLTEAEARRLDIEVASATYEYSGTAYGSAIEDRDGFVKVLANSDTDEIVGCHIIGPHASILIQEAANAMRLRLPVDAITQSIYVHPALPEVVQRAFAALHT